MRQSGIRQSGYDIKEKVMFPQGAHRPGETVRHRLEKRFIGILVSGGSNARLMKVLCVRAALDSRKTDRADRNGRFHFPESNNNIRSLSFHRRQRTLYNIRKERSPRHRAEPGYKNLQTCTGCLSAAGSVNFPRHSATGAGWTRSAPAPEATSAGGKNGGF